MPESLFLNIEKVVPGGEGLARHEGRVMFVPNVLPGEKVRVEVVEAKKDFARAELREVVNASPDRVTPPCPLAGACGGCDWLHIGPEAQARFKVEMARDALRRIGGLDWPDLRIESGAPLGYRNRLQLHTDGSGAVGFLERRGHGFVPVKECPVAHPAFAPLFAKGCPPESPERFHAFACYNALGENNLWREDEHPRAEARVGLLDTDIVFPVGGFFQSNLKMLERLIPHSIHGLSGNMALDLYSGVGLFGAFLKPHFHRVVCVESSREALNFARKNVGTGETSFVAGQLERLVEESDASLSWGGADAALVDPPREGLDVGVRSWLKKQSIPKLVYVSCNPVTLARDLKDLLTGPYVLEDLRLFDFYPQTSHVEAVAKLASARFDCAKRSPLNQQR
jgi:23S rRNA (uracil1939-C5)-methyltransferase